ncbi:von Willebrand factor type A domain-containing protein [Flavobacteriaceae bacterium MAR_2010_105]|nr:von Willebrand factor type A domain-containing protein [Flavobacteriaceae bacterium MAR_2010_105]
MANIIEIGEVTESRTFHQLGILVLDGSGSMAAIGDGNISLADSVNRAVREFLGFFKNSSIANNFSIAVITFDNNSNVHTPITELTSIDDFADYNPLNDHGGGTFIGGALEAAEVLALQFLNNPESTSIPHDVRLLVMSDGLCLAPDQTKLVADRLKQNNKIMICSSLFTQTSKVGESEISEAKTVLSDIASAPNLYKTTYKENDLRQFFISSMSAKRKNIND